MSASEEDAVEQPAAAGPATAEGHTLLFYEELERLDPTRHGRFALATGQKRYDFARPTNSVPLNSVEFVTAARHYPILFNGDARGMPLALVGLRSHENLFVESNGHWAEGCYIPAFVRRYPFLLLNQAESGEIALCVDSAAAMIEENGERLLFRDDQPSDVLENVAQFCAAYAREQNRTRSLVAALQESDILVERAVNIDLPDGQRVAMRGFKVVDSEKFHALPEDTVLEWWRHGWIGAIYAHMVSLGNFGRLFVRAGGAREVPV